MFDKLKSLWGRLQVRWHVLSVALIAAAPEILNWLGVIDLRPVLEYLGVPDGLSGFIVGSLPFALMFVKNAFDVEPEDK